MGTGFWDTVGSGIDALGHAAGVAMPILQQTGVLPASQQLPLPMNVLPGTPAFAAPILRQLPGAAAGAAAGMLPSMFGPDAIENPFRTSQTGVQTAKPFVVERDDGGIEWFIPAGKPTAWSKASVKKRRHTHAHSHPARRRKR